MRRWLHCFLLIFGGILLLAVGAFAADDFPVFPTVRSEYFPVIKMAT